MEKEISISSKGVQSKSRRLHIRLVPPPNLHVEGFRRPGESGDVVFRIRNRMKFRFFDDDALDEDGGEEEQLGLGQRLAHADPLSEPVRHEPVFTDQLSGGRIKEPFRPEDFRIAPVFRVGVEPVNVVVDESAL